MVSQPVQVVINEALDQCFAYPQGFTRVDDGSRVEIIGPHSSSGPLPGLARIEAIDAQGRSVEEIAQEVVSCFGGTPPRSTVMLGGQDTLALDGMPGQDPISKERVVHGGKLYTLNFSPHRSRNACAEVQMETPFASETFS